jgi:hypothetical protein
MGITGQLLKYLFNSNKLKSSLPLQNDDKILLIYFFSGDNAVFLDLFSVNGKYI